MRTRKHYRLHFSILAAVLLWIKTYIVYKANFHFKIENFTQELILLLNPLSFIMFIIGLGIFLRDKRQKIYILMTSFLISFILYANAVYYREFNDFITIPLLMQTNNLGELKSSIFELIKWYDLLYFTDVIILAYIALKHFETITIKPFKKFQATAFFLVAIGLAFLNISMAETQRPQLLTRTFDREILVKNLGTYYFHVYDVFLQTKTNAQRAMANGNELTEIENYTKAHYKEPNKNLFGIAKGKNVILISMESTQSFVIGATLHGQPVTPFLNEFIKDSFYFDNFYHQVGQGKTSDSEFLFDNSLYSLGRGAVFFTHANNTYTTFTKKLKANHYYTAALHANNKSFWNRDIVYENFGYDRYYSAADFHITNDIKVGWGMKDMHFFEQSIQHLKAMPQPFYAKFITLTNHFPFDLDEEDRFIEPYDSNSKTLNQYFPTVRYTDEALKQFIEDLKKNGLYENSMIVIYGDHYGISENHNDAMGQFLGKEITPIDTVQLQRVPLIIHIPGQEGKTISTIGGQVDLKPTLLHLLGINTKNDFQFGADLFAKDRNEFVVLRDGSFITKDYVYKNETCYDKATGEEIEKNHCERYKEQAKQELFYSDKVIYGDLLRFLK